MRYRDHPRRQRPAASRNRCPPSPLTSRRIITAPAGRCASRRSCVTRSPTPGPAPAGMGPGIRAPLRVTGAGQHRFPRRYPPRPRPPASPPAAAARLHRSSLHSWSSDDLASPRPSRARARAASGGASRPLASQSRTPSPAQPPGRRAGIASHQRRRRGRADHRAGFATRRDRLRGPLAAPPPRSGWSKVATS